MAILQILISIFQILEFMEAKKRTNQRCDGQNITNQKLKRQVTVCSNKKVIQNSRRSTKSLSVQSFLMDKYIKHSKQISDKIILFNVEDLLHGVASNFTVSINQSIKFAEQKEFLQSYYCFSKNQSQQSKQRQSFIENKLIELIKNKNKTFFLSEPLMHFNAENYQIMKNHHLRKKIQKEKLGNSKCFEMILKTKDKSPKEATTLKSSRDQLLNKQNQKYQYNLLGVKRVKTKGKDLDTSESVEIRQLAECIRDLFKKNKFVQSQISNRHTDEKTQFKHSSEFSCKFYQQNKLQIDCEISSIDLYSKFEIQAEDKAAKLKYQYNQEPDQNYGLGELKRKYEQHRFKIQNSNPASSVKQKIGHRRSPTEIIFTDAENNYFNGQNQLITKQNFKSQTAWNSSKKIASPKAARLKKSKSKQVSRDFQEDGYCLKYETQLVKRKKNEKPSLQKSKQNLCKLGVKLPIKSKSKSLNKEKVSKAKLLKTSIKN